MEKLPPLHKLCPSFDVRLSLHHILINKDHTVASDAHVLALYSTREMFSSKFADKIKGNILVHKKQWKLMCKKHTISEYDETNQCIVMHYDGYSMLFPVKIEDEIMQYPDYTEIIPDKKDANEINGIGVSGKLLSKLSKCLLYDSINSKGVSLTFFDRTKAILVEPNDNISSSKGIIMPIRVHE